MEVIVRIVSKLDYNLFRERIQPAYIRVTLQGTNISPQNGIFEDDFPFPKVGYVNSLEGIFHLLSTIPVPWTSQYRGTTICFGPETQNAMGLTCWRRVVDVWCRVASTNRWLLLCRWLVSDWGWVTCWCLAFAGIHPEISKTFLQSIFFVCFFPEVLQVCIGLGDFFSKGKANVTSPFLPPFFQGKFLIRCSFQRNLGHPATHTTPTPLPI